MRTRESVLLARSGPRGERCGELSGQKRHGGDSLDVVVVMMANSSGRQLSRWSVQNVKKVGRTACRSMRRCTRTRDWSVQGGQQHDRPNGGFRRRSRR